ncbi:hypothetical protein C366_05696 [Cryptococcus neoformans Tu401-1]|uniref:3-hydroxyacyl-CoA dehydrogenase n=1 Tax=Cryptococcus neoformans Tu259-1 TaxID=1230072 RepID=A0A854QFZ1_CRYNE|nr:hypothetical protein C365_05625 [Cryptococcus neoformans var. grubii Bt85]OXG12876.1 hypothetical protein C366_05696 [Cryptococcus neoformans var. grubii Tu401-1]OXG17199.1 hypothetical protein C361_04810 [Cryptococcus neoformans var. grubii Tu259-1]OXM77093.1 hypothetical protein C364_05609 [Cryptococcus neoformans var. grubii Bt63]
MKISGNTFVITGGTGGIGGATARSLSSQGASVALFDIIPQEKGQAFAQELGVGDKAKYYKVDITDSDAVKAAVEDVVASLGNLKGAVHCAGVAIKREWTNDIAESIPNFKKMLDINVTGTFIVNAHVADAINKPLNHPDGSSKHAPFWTSNEERGVIINFASAAANPYARVLSYGPTKTAVVGITKSFSDFLGPSGIRVASISPSIVVSAMTSNFSTYFSDDLLKTATFPRVPLTADQITPTINYIIENVGINGIDIPVDGGWRLVSLKAGIEGGKDPRELAPGLE